MNILIIEDEPVAAQRIGEMVQENVTDANIIGLCDSIEESVKFFREQPMPDLVLMDIELSDGQSFEIFEEVRVSCPVIFTTAYDEFALRAFQVHSIDYLLKPIQVEDLKRAIKKFGELQSAYASNHAFNAKELMQELRKVVTPAFNNFREHFLVRQGQRLISLGVEEVAYFYSDDRLTFLKTHDGRFFSVDQTLEELEQQVDGRRFFRASRKFLVERKSISNVFVHFNGKFKLILKPVTKDDVMVSRDRAPEFKTWLGA
jgi:two-component system LytT family response regulator